MIAQRLPAPASGKSIDELETASAKKPGDKAALKALGLAYYNAGGYEPAIATLAKLPGDPEALLFQSAALLALGRDNDAVALLLGLKTPQAALLRADYNYLKGGDMTAARTDYAEALKSVATQGEAALALGTILIVDGDRAGARKLFTQAAERLPAGPSRARAYASLGRMIEEGGDGKAARPWYEKALKDDPNNGWARQSLVPTPPPTK
jgi:tetratricopeptide (TPR) repeat protein